jgi:hypothetical protein
MYLSKLCLTLQLGPQHFHPDLRSAMLEVESLGYSGRMTTTRFGNRFANDA